jgi:O-acetyl-ADP-ribose deacetylase (regulator of RNase III)/uncharacterized protein YwgA
MSSSAKRGVTLTRGDLLKSSAHALVNTVNCVGIMGKGVALSFKRKYPEMFADYVKRCDRDEVKLGHPYVYNAGEHLIVNFPTKGHWRAVSKLADIESGLVALRDLVAEWDIRSIAVPPLGCGNGQLDWSVVGPTLERHLGELDILVELYVPHELTVESAQFELFSHRSDSADPATLMSRIDAPELALVEILRNVETQRYSWPVGRIKFQKLAYFATASGIPTGLEFEPASFGPYADGLKKMIARLQNNGLVEERKVGRLFETRVGPTYEDTRAASSALTKWELEINRVSDLMVRLNTTQSEIAATVHFAATHLTEAEGRRPTASETIAFVERWKTERRPAVDHDDVARAVVNLATLGWIDVQADESVESFVDELVPF